MQENKVIIKPYFIKQASNYKKLFVKYLMERLFSFQAMKGLNFASKNGKRCSMKNNNLLIENMMNVNIQINLKKNQKNTKMI